MRDAAEQLASFLLWCSTHFASKGVRLLLSAHVMSCSKNVLLPY